MMNGHQVKGEYRIVMWLVKKRKIAAKIRHFERHLFVFFFAQATKNVNLL
jgi:hypothetical protein